jgi:hypothetical protein
MEEVAGEEEEDVAGVGNNHSDAGKASCASLFRRVGLGYVVLVGLAIESLFDSVRR